MSIRQVERGLEPRRAVEVISTRDNSTRDEPTNIYGSGYRIGGWLVLTAAHLVNCVGADCKVRWYAQNTGSGEEKDKVDTKAKVVWKNLDLDIALIELPQTVSKEEPIALGKLPKGERAEEITFQISGYPRFGVVQEVSNRLNFSGTINLGDSSLWLRIQEPLNSEWTIARIIQEINKDDQKLRSEWEGMSGAAVICNGLVVAVQTRHQRPMQPNYVEATPLEKVNTAEDNTAEDNTAEEWHQLLKEHGINPEPEIVRLEAPSSKTLWRELFDNFWEHFSSEANFSKHSKDLLDKVEHEWVKRNLDNNSFYNQVPIKLSLEQRLDLVEFRSPEQPERLKKILPKGTKPISIFNNLGRAKSLLILGEPGSGKSMALLELTQSLVKESRRTSTFSVPILLNLSSWADTYQSLDFWLVRQLDDQYGIRNKRFIKALIRERETIFVLDGLDEVKQEFQASCIQAINKFRSDYAQVSIVVGSRLKDYEQNSLRLKFRSAVCIQALSSDEINQYLRAEIEASKSVNRRNIDDSDLKIKVKQLVAIRELIHKDTDLQQIVDTPLMLSIIYAIADSQTPIKSVLKYGSPEERRQRLFDAYITRVLERRTSDQELLEDQKYKEDDMKRWLCWLSRYMNQQSNTSDSQTEFRIEQLQPHCLETDVRRYQLLVFAMSCFRGLKCGILTGGSSYLLISTMLPISSNKADVFVISGIISSLITGIAFGLFTGLLVGIASAFFKDIKTVKALTWSFDIIVVRIRKFTSRLLYYFLKENLEESEKEFFGNTPSFEERSSVFMLVALSFTLVFKQNEIYSSYVMFGDKRFIEGYETMVASGVTLSDVTACLLTLTIAGWFLLGLGTSEGSRKRFPGQGILESQSVSSSVLLFMTVVIQPIYFYVLVKFIHAQPQFFSLQSGLVAATITIATFWCGGITKIQHFALRDVLSSNNFIPRDLENFLTLSTKVLLLKRFGGGYSFFHPLLQKHFLGISEDPMNPGTGT